ncbi:MAG: monovalent cation/H(+) antiporter subunit G [Gemmatimonadetes bacterium]|nr:monovalent cation/H(+) antiporter subunit G [Gemmatimonadota bacterium]
METALDVLSWVAIAGGLFFMLVGTVGILRMPDVYTRLHAAGMTDTMGAGLLLLGMALQTIAGIMHGESGYWFVLIRIVLIYGFLLFTSPIACHALARAGIAGGVEPWSNDGEGGV